MGLVRGNRCRARFAAATGLVVVGMLLLLAAAWVPQAQGATRAGDIVLILDESGSMGPRVEAIKNRFLEVVAGVTPELNPRFALVAFGGVPPGQPRFEPFVIANVSTPDTFRSSLEQAGSFASSTGSEELGIHAAEFAMNEVVGWRAGAAVCAILVTDEDPTFRANQETDMARAIDALKARNAVFLGIVDTGSSLSRATYGPDPGSLSAVTGGEVFDIDDFAADSTAVLGQVIERCAEIVPERAAPIAFGAVPTTGVVPLTVIFEAESDPAIEQYRWDFGDGNVGAGRNVQHTFTVAGTFVVSLEATDSFGQTSTTSITISVRGSGNVGIRLSDCTILGTAGDDTLVGTRGDDVICGLAGNDTIRGKKGADVLIGGAGHDRLIGQRGSDVLRGNRGRDVLLAGAGGDELDGGPGSDTLSGSRGRDILTGRAGSDTLKGGKGGDILRGAAGADRLSGGPGNDVLRGGRGPDVLLGGAGHDRLIGGNSRDTLLADDGVLDIVVGGNGVDTAELDRRDRARLVEVIVERSAVRFVAAGIIGHRSSVCCK